MDLLPVRIDGGINSSPDKTFAAELLSCRDALVALPADGPLKRLREPVIRLAQAGRRSGVPPEQLIVTLKTLLFRLPHFEMRRAVERGEMMHQLVTIAINAYYVRADD